MDIRALKYEAGQSLRQAAYSPRRLVLIHTGVALGVSVLLALISYFLDSGVSSGGGLSGMDAQAALETAQVVLQLISLVVLPFWQAGMIFAALRMARRQPSAPRDLAEGLRRFMPLLSSGLMMGLQYVGRGFVAMYLSSMLVMMTPFSAPYYQFAAMLEKNPELDITALNLDGMMWFFVAYLVIFVLVYGALTLPVFYRYRMVNYVIMDKAGIGGVRAVFLSQMMMRGRRMKLFKLDLSFWWFYGLELLLSLVSLGSLVLPLLGIGLPVSDDAAYWIFQLLAVVGQLVLYCLARPKLEVTYAQCYEAFLQPEEPNPQMPREHPWTY